MGAVPNSSIGIVVARGMKPAADIPSEDAAAIASLLVEANVRH
ncbi:MAG: hypothetical protein RSG23_06375 [Gordonibacter sp.]